jgi:hypothetical protein
MKNKLYNVNYSYRTHFDTVISAPSKEAAQKKVTGILGDVRFEGVWEVKPRETQKED